MLLNKGYLTDVRTTIAGAIASKHLVNKNITDVGIIGRYASKASINSINACKATINYSYLGSGLQ